MNRWVSERGVEAGLVRIEEDSEIIWKVLQAAPQFLAYSDDPYVPGISYREDKAFELLIELGIKIRKDDGSEKALRRPGAEMRGAP